MIPLSVPNFKGNEWTYIKNCLDTEWVSSVGKYVETFEQKICDYTGSKYSVACSNGTAALQVALRIAGVNLDDEVIVPTLTFISSINVVSYLGAKPIFMDSDEYYNLDNEKTCDFILQKTHFKDGSTYNNQTGNRISAIIPVHIFGNPVYLDDLYELCKDRNIKIIEDAAESLGSYYVSGKFKSKHTGTIGDIGCFSFNGNKIITTGGGGMLVTDNEEYARRAKYLTTQAKDDSTHFIHNEIGYNFRLTNIQAALGVAQLEQLPKFLKNKKKYYNAYKSEINKIKGLHIAKTPDYAKTNYWFYCMQIDKKVYGKGREELMTYLTENGIQTRPIWYLNHLQKPYTKYQNYKIKNSIDLYEKTLNIPCSTNLSGKDINKVIQKLKIEK